MERFWLCMITPSILRLRAFEQGHTFMCVGFELYKLYVWMYTRLIVSNLGYNNITHRGSNGFGCELKLY